MQTDIYQAVYDDILAITARPDLVDETTLAIRTATRSIHSRALFPRDVISSIVQLPNAVYQVALDTQVLFTRFRTLSGIRAIDSQGNPMPYPVIELVELDDIYDPVYKNLRNDIAYLAGTAVNVRTSVAASGFVVEYFSLPDVRAEHYNSWIAQLAPDAITYQAASIVSGATGNEDRAKLLQALVDRQHFPELLANYSTTAGR